MNAYNGILYDQLVAAIVRNVIAPDDRQAAEEAAYFLYVAADLIGQDGIRAAMTEAKATVRRAAFVVV